MNRRGTVFAALVVCFTCLAASAYGAPGAKYVEGEQARLAYELKNARVISQGQTVSDDKGVLNYDYVIEADAVPADGPARTGPAAVFRAKLSSFGPSRNMPGQQAGTWYLQGVWTIRPTSSANSFRPFKEKRHESVSYRGMLDSTLKFDPFESSGYVSANIKVPTSLSGDGWLSGTGSFTGDSSFAGMLILDVNKPPQAKPVESKEVKP